MVSNVEFWKVFEATEESCDKKCDECPVWWVKKQVCLHEDIANWQVWNVEQKTKRQEMFSKEE